MTIYCVYLTYYGGNRLPPFYIGFSKVAKVQKGYHGSVSSKRYRDIWHSELARAPHLFKTHTIKTFETAALAKACEGRLQQSVKAHSNPLYINQCTQGQHFYFTDEEYKEMARKRCADPNYRRKVTENNKRTWADPVVRARRSAGIRASRSNPEYLAQQSLRSRAQANDPEYIAKLSAGVAKTWADPEHRKLRTEINRRSARNPDVLAKKRAKRWWTDGTKSTHSATCPEGFRAGRTFKPKS